MINRGGIFITYDAYNLTTGFRVIVADDREINRVEATIHLPRDCSHYKASIRSDMPSTVTIIHDRETTGVAASVRVHTYRKTVDGHENTPGEPIQIVCDTGTNDMISGQSETISLMSI